MRPRLLAALLASLLALSAASCGGPQKRLDRDRIDQNAKKAQHDSSSRPPPGRDDR